MRHPLLGRKLIKCIAVRLLTGNNFAMAEVSKVKERWERYRDVLRLELKDAGVVTFQIPGWEPVGDEQGYRWLQASVFEGFKVAHEINWAGNAATVVFSLSED